MNSLGRSMGQRLLQNTLFNFAGRLWVIGANLLLAPILLSYLGQDRFAIWALFWALSQYFFLLDLGLGASLVKHFAQFRAGGEEESINQAITTVFWLYLGASLLVLLLLWPAASWFAARLSLPEGLLGEAVLTFRGGLMILVLMNLVNLFDAVLKGFLRMDLTNLALMAATIPNLVGSYLVLRAGWGLQGLVLTAGCVYLLQLILLLIATRQAFRGFDMARRHLRWDMVRTLFRYGVQLQIPRLAELIAFQSDKILLGLLTPVRYVTFYDLGAKVASVLHDLPYVLFGAVFPAAAELAGRGDKERLWLLYERGSKYLLLVSLPILFGLWLTAHWILQAWLGHVSADVQWAVLLLATGYWTNISVGMVAMVGSGVGWVKPLMRVGLLQGGLNLGLSLALILMLGYIGALLGTVAALLVSNTYLLLRFCRDFGRPLSEYYLLMGRVALVNAPAVLLSGLYLLWTDAWLPQGSRTWAMLAFGGCVAVYAVAYAMSIRWSGVLDGVDDGLLGAQMPLYRLIVGRIA